MIKVKKDVKGITMVSLVVIIIILLLLASISMGLVIGKNGLFNRSKIATKESTKQEAIEAMNLKITGIQIESYTEKQELASLQYLSDKLCEDIDIEYVEKETRRQASLDKIDVTGLNSIFTKIKKYPYEFEIDGQLRLASIDGVKIIDNDKNADLIARLERLEHKSAMTAGLRNIQLTTTSYESEKINFNKVFTSIGDGFELTNGEIKIQKDISYIELSTQISIDTGNNGNRPVVEIYQNDVIVCGMAGANSNWENVGIYNIILKVKKDDVLKVMFRNAAVGLQIHGEENALSTYVTIKEIK